jgi:hypothetical protein
MWLADAAGTWLTPDKEILIGGARSIGGEDRWGFQIYRGETLELFHRSASHTRNAPFSAPFGRRPAYHNPRGCCAERGGAAVITRLDLPLLPKLREGT